MVKLCILWSAKPQKKKKKSLKLRSYLIFIYYLLLLFFFYNIKACYYHRIERKQFKTVLQNRDGKGTAFTLGEEAQVDDVLEVYAQLRKSLNTTYKTWRYIIVVIVALLAVYWVFGMWSFLFKGKKEKKKKRKKYET